MSQKIIEVKGVGPVIVAKRRGTRSLRLSIRPDGSVRVGLPSWVPYSAGSDFAYRRRDWINRHRQSSPPLILNDGQRIGKSYRLEFVSRPSSKRTHARVAANLISVHSPHSHTHANAQKSAQLACERALKREADALLGQRLGQLAAKHGFKYKDLRIKRLTSRWGSCNENKLITLNYFLVQLPWHLIDYVIIHELAHTRHLDHSREFWQSIEKILPDAKQLRREIKQYRPVLMPC